MATQDYAQLSVGISRDSPESDEGGLELQAINHNDAMDDKLLQHYLGWLPKWARNEKAARHALACKKYGNTHPLDRVAGPAVTPAFVSTLILWAFFGTFPWFALHFTECSSDGKGFAQVPDKLLVWYLPFLVASLILEYIGMCKVLPGIIVSTGPLRLFGFQPTFSIWFAFAFTQSIIGHLDFATISLMLAKAVKTDECSEHGKSVVGAIWKTAIDQSIYDGFLFEGFLRISTIATVGYCLIFAQLIFALLNSVPIHKHTSPFHYDLQAPEKYPVWFDSCARTKQGHGDALFALAVASHMNTLCFTRVQYASVAMQMWEARLVYEELKRTVTRVMVFNLMSSAIQPNIQGSICALAIASSNEKHAQKITLVSNVLSIFAAFKGLVEEGLLTSTLYRMVQNASVSTKNAESTQEDRDAIDWKSRSELRRFAVVAFLSSLLQLYAITKLSAAVFFCPDGLWNLYGCVDVH